MCFWVWKCNFMPEKSELWYAGEMETKVGVRYCDKRNFWMKKQRLPKYLGGMSINSCKQHINGSVPVLCLHATVFTATKEWQIALSVLAAVTTMFQSVRCTKEQCNNSTTGVVPSSINSQKICLRYNLLFYKKPFDLKSYVSSF